MPPTNHTPQHPPRSLPATQQPVALLVHGIGSRTSWWDPLLPTFRAVQLRPKAVQLPALDTAGPAAWRDAVLEQIPPHEAVVLVGHSLGAAVCIEAAQSHPALALILLACPPFFPDYDPGPPPASHLAPEILETADRFLRRACARTSTRAHRTLHLVGDRDRWCPAAQAARLPYPLEVVPAAGHGLNRAQPTAALLTRWFRANLPGLSAPQPPPVEPSPGGTPTNGGKRPA